MRVLICGGRDFSDWGLFCKVLDPMHPHIVLLVHGGAKGADSLAEEWGYKHGVPCSSYPVLPEDWQKLGKRAGPIRNGNMLRATRPNLVIAFQGGRGTADCCKQARALGIAVLRVEP